MGKETSAQLRQAGQTAKDTGHRAGHSPENADLTIWDKFKKVCRIIYKVVTSHFGLVLILIAYSFAGAAIFQQIEGSHEARQKQDIIEMRTHILERIQNHTAAILNDSRSDAVPVNVTADDTFIQMLQGELKAYEDQLHVAFLHGINSDSEETVWDFWGALFFCATIYTTIGYGHIAPATEAGRIATMAYGVIGIPLCLVVLADLGKLFTRYIKYLWSFLRRFYHTGTCVRIRQTEAIRMVGQKIDDVGGKLEQLGDKLDQLNPLESTSGKDKAEGERAEEIDDEFNLPPIVAILITVVYIFCGAVMYKQWEDWTYLEAFYFVFVSISTIGFGDVLPEYPKYFLASFVYLLVGLSLVAMVINVIMIVVSDTIDRAKETMIQVGKKTVGINFDPNAQSSSNFSDNRREEGQKNKKLE